MTNHQPELVLALEYAEDALADIGDADREDGDDLAWCENRAKEALPQIRKTLQTYYKHHLKSEALAALHKYESGQVVLTKKALSAILRALEELPND